MSPGSSLRNCHAVVVLDYAVVSVVVVDVVIVVIYKSLLYQPARFTVREFAKPLNTS